MRSTLIDAGPLIALFDRSDRYHRRAVEAVKAEPGRLVSTWPVVTETSHMLDFDPRAQTALLEWIRRGGLELHDISGTELGRIIELMEQYADVPMDLADASLVASSEELGIARVLSIDRDFYDIEKRTAATSRTCFRDRRARRRDCESRAVNAPAEARPTGEGLQSGRKRRSSRTCDRARF